MIVESALGVTVNPATVSVTFKPSPSAAFVKFTTLLYGEQSDRLGFRNAPRSPCHFSVVRIRNVDVSGESKGIVTLSEIHRRQRRSVKRYHRFVVDVLNYDANKDTT